MQPEKVELAKQIFKDTKINITSDGQRHLGAAINSVGFRDIFVKEKDNDWVFQLIMLSNVATFYPQAAYCAFTAGFRHKFNYILRTIPDLSKHLQPVEDVIRHKFIPALCEGRSCSDDERLLLSLPVKLGGLGIPYLTRIAALEYDASRSIIEPIAKKIISQNDLQDNSNNYVPEYSDITKKKSEYYQSVIAFLRRKITSSQCKANEIACSDGASIWLSSLLLKSESSNLSKREFYDGLYLRYGWNLKNLPSECVCTSKFSTDHALSCKIGGFVTLRHNEMRDLTADLLSTVCKDVCKEPCLQQTI